MLYTNDPNHPVTDIYIEKAMALMARHRYADALHIFRSLPDHLLEGSLDVMARYAAKLTGQEVGTSTSARGGEADNLRGRLARLEQVVAEQREITQGLIPLLDALRAGGEGL